MEEEGVLAQTHNVVAKYWGKGGILKWAEFLCSRASLWNGTPTPSFIGQKYSNSCGNSPKNCIHLQFVFFTLFYECMQAIMVQQVCVCGK